MQILNIENIVMKWEAYVLAVRGLTRVRLAVSAAPSGRIHAPSHGRRATNPETKNNSNNLFVGTTTRTKIKWGFFFIFFGIFHAPIEGKENWDRRIRAEIEEYEKLRVEILRGSLNRRREWRNPRKSRVEKRILNRVREGKGEPYFSWTLCCLLSM